MNFAAVRWHSSTSVDIPKPIEQPLLCAMLMPRSTAEKRLTTTPFEREISAQPLSRDSCLRLIQVVGARKLCQQLLHRHPRQCQLHSNQATARSLQQGRHRMWLFSVLRLSQTWPVSSPVSRLRFLAALPVRSYHQRDRDQNATKRLRPPPTEESKPKAPSES